MIDPKWLETLTFPIDGGKVVGLAGRGAHNVVLHAVMTDGSERAIRCPKQMISFHISEPPPWLVVGTPYSVKSVNQELRKFVGQRNFDTCSTYIDELCSLPLKIISEHGIGGFLFSNMRPESVVGLPFILHSPPIRRKLQEWADWVYEEEAIVPQMPSVNGEQYGVYLLVSRDEGCISKWVHDALKGLDRLPEYEQELKADTVFDNPLVIWGAAAMEGFFTDSEMREAAEFISMTFGRILERGDAGRLIGQVDVLANLFAQYLPDAPVDRFVRVSAACGVLIQARNKAGEIVADGLRMISML